MKKYIPLLIIILFAVLMEWPVIFQGKTVSSFDIAYSTMNAFKDVKPAGFKSCHNNLLSDPLTQMQPWDISMFDGPISYPWLWNPYIGCGSPLLATSQSAPFFPLKYPIYFLFGVRMGFGILYLLKMMLAGFFMWSYLRVLKLDAPAALFGSLNFMACGYMIVWIMYPHTNVAMFLPLVFLGCERLREKKFKKGFMIVAFTVFSGFLGGHPETVFHIGFSGTLYLIFRSSLKLPHLLKPNMKTFVISISILSMAISTGVLLGAVQVLPTVEYLLLSYMLDFREMRGERISGTVDYQKIFSFVDKNHSKKELLTYLLPNIFGNPSHQTPYLNKNSNYNESAGYTGLSVVLLALFSWRFIVKSNYVRSMILLQLISLGFILRFRLIMYTFERLPLMELAANKRFLLIFCFCTASLGAKAFHELLQIRKYPWKSVICLMLLVAGLFFVAQSGLTYAAERFDDFDYKYQIRYFHHFVFFLLVTWFAVALILCKNQYIKTVACSVMILCTAGDLYFIHYNYAPFLNPDRLYPETETIRFLKSNDYPRVLPLGYQIGPNILSMYGIQESRIYDAVTYLPYAKFHTMFPAKPLTFLTSYAPSVLTEIASIRYIWTHQNWMPPQGNLIKVFEDGINTIYEDLDARPQVYISTMWKFVPNADDSLKALIDPKQDPYTIYLDPGILHAKKQKVPNDPNIRKYRKPFQKPINQPLAIKNKNKMKPLPVSNPVTFESAMLRERSSLNVTVDLPGTTSGVLVLSDCYYPGWKAYVDGQQRTIHRALGTFRAVFVSPEDAVVEFQYDPVSFRLGLFLSLLTMLLVISFQLGIFDKKPQKRR